ncbi:hypothetical protein [Rhizobium sp. SAFR-030]|uniref:hypothetical protein n=1 Tax=Rhizobium sp. SAFR-030 TaxID=3387277 RepID=UPI003F80E3BD
MRFCFARLAVLPVMILGALTACSTTGGGSQSTALLSGKTSNGTPFIAALQGGIVGSSGIEISTADRQRALEAEYRALEGAAVGQPVVWAGRGAKGEVVAAAPYQVGSQNCRQYRHTLSASGKEVKARGAACRNPDGTWTPLT